jgi:hypothetical protein
LAFDAQINYRETHRLIPTQYSDESVLETLDLPAQVIANLSELDAATNERVLAERGQSLTIGVGETLQGVPEYQIVNAAFAYAGSGSRFSDSRRGAWYAGTEIETSFAEVAFHKRRFLQDSRFTDPADYEYRDFLADFAGTFSHLEESEKMTCLEPEPVPQCYGPGASSRDDAPVCRIEWPHLSKREKSSWYLLCLLSPCDGWISEARAPVSLEN